MDFNFDQAADSTKLPRPTEDSAHGEEKENPDLAVRSFETEPGHAFSLTDSESAHVTDAKEGDAEDLLNFDPYGRKKPSDAEQAAPATDDHRPSPTQPPEHAHEPDVFGLDEKDHNTGEGSILTPSHILSDSPAHASIPPSDNPIPVLSEPAATFAPGSSGDMTSVPILSDERTDTSSKSSEGKSSPPLEHDNLLEFGTSESKSDNVEPALDSYLNEPTPTVDTPFEMPATSTAAPATEVSDESLESFITDSAAEPQNPLDSVHSTGSVLPVGNDVPTPEQTPTFPQSDSPIPVETAPKPDGSFVSPSTSSDVFAAEAPAPYINPDPFQDYIPPVEKKELGDHQSARIPSPSSMDAEPPTPVERSSLSSLKETQEVAPAVDAEGAVDSLPLEVLRHRDVQEALASVIPPAPDKPLPPTPGSERRGGPAGCLLSLSQLPVMEILLWRDPKKSGAVFATGLVVLLSMMYCSFISVVAYFALALLTVTLGFRLYKTVLGMVQKTNDGHPFQDLLSVDTTVSQEKGHELADKAVAELNCCSTTLKDLFLVKDIFESVKFGFVLYLLTYLGAWFNTMTLVIMGYVALFTLPKVYEQNKEKIDEVLGQVKEKVGEISAKVKAAIPMGKKTAAASEPVPEEKKEE